MMISLISSRTFLALYDKDSRFAAGVKVLHL
jgi:hypothetical protein